MSFRAEYPGECATCSELIVPGDNVKYRRDELVHVVCPEVDALRLVPQSGAPCPRCFCYHAGTC